MLAVCLACSGPACEVDMFTPEGGGRVGPVMRMVININKSKLNST